ncbi:MAG: hypothetical protein KY468_16355 [Armatimonadetes bacterium]|nr:hypothetical protein [Armatimonadota bacterium]
MLPVKKKESTKAAETEMAPGVTRRLTLIIGGGVITLALLLLLPDRPQSAPARNSSASRKVVKAPAPAPAAAPRSLKDYSSLMGRDLFEPLVKNEARRPAAAPPPSDFNAPPGLSPLPPMTLRDGVPGRPSRLNTPPSGVEGWKYIGSVTVDGETFALLQKTSTGDTGYYRVGEKLGNGIIQSISRDTLVVAAGGEPIRLPKTSGAPATTAAGAPSRQVARSGQNQQNQGVASGNTDTSGDAAAETRNSVEAAPAEPGASEQNDRQQQRQERRRRFFRQNGGGSPPFEGSGDEQGPGRERRRRGNDRQEASNGQTAVAALES